MITLSDFINECIKESEDKKIKELENKLDKVEDKAEDAEDAAEDAEDAAEDAEDAAEDAEDEASKAEETIKDEDDFRDYAKNKFEKVFGDKLDEDKMNKIVDGILDKYADDAEKGNWGKLVGVLNKSFGGR